MIFSSAPDLTLDPVQITLDRLIRIPIIKLPVPYKQTTLSRIGIVQ